MYVWVLDYWMGWEEILYDGYYHWKKSPVIWKIIDNKALLNRYTLTKVGSNAWDFRLAMIAWFSKTSQCLPRISDNFQKPSKLNRKLPKLWALMKKRQLWRVLIDFVRTPHSKPFLSFRNFFVGIELNFRYYSCIKSDGQEKSTKILRVEKSISLIFCS